MSLAPPELAAAPPAPGQLEVDSSTRCSAPYCGLPLDEHTGTPKAVDLFPVGNETCAQSLYRHRRASVRASWVRDQLAAGTLPTLPGVPHFGPIRTDDPIFARNAE